MQVSARRAFSLIELVIVVVIIGIIAAIAIPRMSRGATGAAENSIKTNLAAFRNALELFQTENGGQYPASAAAVAQALTGFSDGAGNAIAYDPTTRPPTHPYGPYMRDIPVLPLGTGKGSATIAAAAGSGVGWVYSATTHDVKANTGNATYDAW